MDLILSDALPVQWWLTGQETFNQGSGEGITFKRPFYQKWQYQDDIKNQVTYDQTLQMGIFTAQGDQIFDYDDFTVVAGDLQMYNFRPADIPAIVAVNSRMKIYLSMAVDGVEVAYTDVLDIKKVHPMTRLLRYSHPSNFQGIIYSGYDFDFYIRVPGAFRVQNNPMTVEDLPLNSGRIVTLVQDIQRKQMLQMDFQPDFLIYKTQLALMHDVIEIDGMFWKRRDGFNDQPIDRFELKRSNVLLTRYNSAIKNVVASGAGGTFDDTFDETFD